MVAFPGFGMRDMENMRTLVGTIFDGGKGGGQVEEAAAQREILADLGHRGTKVQTYIGQQIADVYTPEAAKTESELKTTSEMLRAERKNLIEDHMRAHDLSLRDKPTYINGKLVVTHKHNAKQKDGAHRTTASFQLLEENLAAMEAKLNGVTASSRASTDARAVMIKAQEQQSNVKEAQAKTRSAQKAKMDAQLAARRAAKRAERTSVST